MRDALFGLGIIGAILLILLLLILAPWIVAWAWNGTMPLIFGLVQITPLVALRLLVLLTLVGWITIPSSSGKGCCK